MIRINSMIRKLNDNDPGFLLRGADVEGWTQLAEAVQRNEQAIANMAPPPRVPQASEIENFTDLKDTVPSLKGLAGLPIRVRSDEQGLEGKAIALKEMMDVNMVHPEPGDVLVYTKGGWQNETPLSPISAKVFGVNGEESGEIISKTSNVVFYRNHMESVLNTVEALNGDMLWVHNENDGDTDFVQVVPASDDTVDGKLSPYAIPRKTEVVLVYNAQNKNWQVSLIRGLSSSQEALMVVGNPAEYPDVSRITFPTSNVSRKKDGSVEVTPYLKLTKRIGDEGGEGKITELRYMAPLKATVPPATKGAAFLEVDDRAYTPLGNASFLAYLEEETYLTGKVLGDGTTSDGSLNFRSVICSSGNYIVGDSDTRSFTINRGYSDGFHDNYLLSGCVGMIGQAPEEGFVRAYFRMLDMRDPIKDLNGQPMAYQKNYRAGDKLGVLCVSGIGQFVEDESKLQFVVETNIPTSILLGDRVTGPTGVLIQGMTNTISTSPAANQWQVDTGMALRFAKHSFGSDLSDFNWLLKNPTAGEVKVSAGTKLILAGGYHLHAITPLIYEVNFGNVSISNDPETNKFDFSFGKVFSAEKTKLLIDRELKFDFMSTYNMMPSSFALAIWTGAPDRYTEPVFTSRDGNDNPVLEVGWEIVRSETLGEGDTGPLNTTFTVPENAVNFAIVMFPHVGRMPTDIKNFYLFQITCDPFDGYVMSPTLTANEQLARWASNSVVTNMGDFSTRRWFLYVSGDSGDPAGGPLPVGVVDTGYDLVKVDRSFHIPKGIVGNEVTGCGALVFQKAGSVSISTELHMYSVSDVGAIDRATYAYYKVTSKNPLTLVKIDASETNIPVFGGLAETTAQTGIMKTFTINVEAGDMIVLRGAADNEQRIYLEATSPANWMLHTVMTYNSFT